LAAGLAPWLQERGLKECRPNAGRSFLMRDKLIFASHIKTLTQFKSLAQK